MTIHRNLLNTRETGRTLLEMLSILAIIGVLSIVAVVVYHVALNKARANQIIHDARLAHADLAFRPHASPSETWEEVHFTPESHKRVTFQLKENLAPYVRISEIERGICQQLLPFGHNEKVSILTTTFAPFEICEETNEMVFFFGEENVVPAGDDCVLTEDCGEGFFGYCDNGYCVTCPEEIPPAFNGTGCGATCDAETETQCDNGVYQWCCDSSLQCGRSGGECSDGKCSYEYTQTANPQTDCSYTYSQGPQEADCSFRIDVSGDVATFVFIENCTMPNTYCVAKHTNKYDCSTTISESETGTLYGVCNPMNMKDATCPIPMTMSSIKECPAHSYCYLNYTDTSCSSSAVVQPEQTGTIHGVCNTMSLASTVCSIQISMTEKVACPVDQYCLLKWKSNASCATLEENATNTLYGVCTPADSNIGTCPYP